MNLFLLIASILWYAVVPSSVETDDEIRWSQRSELGFSDFKGEVPSNTPWAALTSSFIYFTYSTTNGKISTIKVYASFKKKESWMKTNRDDVLAHEQLHFAITEYFARKLYSDAQQLKQRSGNISPAANALFQSINSDCDKVQQDYDDETDHGVNAEAQEKWKKKVALMLKDFEAYPEITD